MITNVRPPVVQTDGLGRTFRRAGRSHVALHDVSITVRLGRTLAVIGESGSGKTTLSRLLTGLDTPTFGTVLLDGAPPRLPRRQVSKAQMVYQDPYAAFNPRWTIERSLAEPLMRLRSADRRLRIAALLESVGLAPSLVAFRPRQLSGGQLQRAGLARALAAEPALLVCDEPTSSLDVSIQAQIINLLLDVQERIGFAMVIVTHDLAVARVLADDVILLSDGEVVEGAPANAFFAGPLSEYGQRLLAAASPTNRATNRLLWTPGRSLAPLSSEGAASAGAGTSGG